MAHASNRSKLCLLCLKYQCSYSNKAKSVKYRHIIASKEQVIKKYFISNYQFVDDSWPSVVCSSCNNALNEAKRGVFSRKIQPYQFTPPYTGTRARQNSCDCFFCQIVAKEKDNSPITFRKNAKTHKEKATRLCSKCLTEIGKGKRHSCHKVTLVERAKTILQENDAEGPVIAQIVNESTNKTMNLRNLRGKPRVLHLSPPKHIEPISVSDFNEIQKDFVGSGKKTGKLLTKLRRKGIPIEPKVQTTVQDETNEVQTYFNVSDELVEISNESNRTKQNRAIVFCSRLNDFINFILPKRHMTASDDILLKFTTDDGGHYLKICMTIVDKSRRNDEKNGKLTSVKRIFLVCLANQTPETNFNLKVMFSLIGLKDFTSFHLDVWFTGDFKIQNKSVGVQDCGCMYPCFICEANKNDLDNPEYRLRTFGSIRANNQNWIQSGGIKKDLQNYYSCIATPIFTEAPDECPVNEVFVMGELHMLLRVTNNICDQILKVDPDNMNAWIKKNGLVRQGAFKAFNGNQCKIIIERAMELKTELVSVASHFAEILSAFNNLVSSCFGQQLNEEWENYHEIFFWLIKHHNIKMTPSMHTLKYHVPEFIHTKQMALGIFSEQAGESIHHEWKIFFEKYEQASNDNFQHTLLRAVSKFNYLNI